jgi:hypothetical protein
MRQCVKNTVQPDMPQMAIWRMRIAACIPNATNTNSQYVILIAFPLQQWLQERASLLRHTHMVFLVTVNYCFLYTTNNQ